MGERNAVNGTNGSSHNGGTVAHISSAAELPCALDKLDQISGLIADKTPVFFLDYDGTLCFIVASPDNARMTPDTKAVLKQLSEQYPACIVTGRALNKVKLFVQLPNLTYAGAHGAEMEGPTIGKVVKGEEHKPTLVEIMNRLKVEVDNTPGALIEDNSMSVSVHYRHVPEDKVEQLHQAVVKEVEAANFKLTTGKKVWEIRAGFDWDKGQSVKYILETLKMDDRELYIPIYMGDDRTDEDAFKVLAPRGGICVLVHDGDRTDDRLTAANYKVGNPDKVREFLGFFAKSDQFRKNGGFGKGGKVVETTNDDGTATGAAGMAS